MRVTFWALLIAILTSCGTEDKKADEPKFKAYLWTDEQMDASVNKCATSEATAELTVSSAKMFCDCLVDILSRDYDYKTYAANRYQIADEYGNNGKADVCLDLIHYK